VVPLASIDSIRITSHLQQLPTGSLIIFIAVEKKVDDPGQVLQDQRCHGSLPDQHLFAYLSRGPVPDRVRGGRERRISRNFKVLERERRQLALMN
jgi:hypothetical protein